MIKKKYCFLLIIVSIILILATGMTSAAEITNDTTELIENTEPVSYDAEQNQYNEIVKNTQDDTKSDYYVTSNAKDNTDATQTTPTTLTSALNNIQDGQTIILTTNNTSDTYKFTQALSISKNIKIIIFTNNTSNKQGGAIYNYMTLI